MRLRLNPFAPNGISEERQQSNSFAMPGKDGVGVPAGGTTNQVLAKNSNTNYDTKWVDVSGGPGTTNHADLTNLDYASSGHTGFEPAKGADDNYVTDTEKSNLHAPMSDNQVADGVTITGTGTLADPFVAVTGGAGDVVGPASATDGNFAAFNTNTGKLIKDSGYSSSSFAAALGADDNYVTDAEKAALHPAVTISGEDFITATGQAITANPIDLDNLSATGTPSSNNFLRGDNTWSEITLGSGGYAANVYLTNQTSTIDGSYKQISYTNDASTTAFSTAVNNNEVLIDTFLYESVLGISTIDAGTWGFYPYGKVSSPAGSATLKFEIFVRTSGGTETTLFSKYSPTISNTTYARIEEFSSYQNQFTVNATDRLGIRVYAKNTVAASVTVYFEVGDDTATYFNTPLALRHTQLRGLNDDANNVHISQANVTDLTDGGATTLHKHSYNNLDDKPTIPTQYTDEMAQDAVGNAVGNGLDYDDTTGAIAVDETELAHNSLGSKQGGTTNEYYHLTSAEVSGLHAAATVADSTSIDMSITGQQISAAAIFGTTAGTVCQGNDARLSDARTPVAHNQAETTITFTNVTTGNASTTAHGFEPKATAPASGNLNVEGIANGETARSDKLLLDSTAPSTQAFGDTAAAGTSLKAARIDHKHAMPAAPTNATTVTAANEATDQTCFPVFVTAATGDLGPKTNTNLTYNALSAILTSPNINVDTIGEKTSANGVAIDGMQIKDSHVIGGAGLGINNASLDTTAGGIGGAWTSTTPSLTNIAIGTGGSAANVQYYTQIGKTVHVRGHIILGSSGQSVSGTITIALPITASSNIYTNTSFPIGACRIQDAPSGAGHFGYVDMSSTTTMRILVTKADATYTTVAATSSTVPFTWGDGDFILYYATYEAA